MHRGRLAAILAAAVLAFAATPALASAPPASQDVQLTGVLDTSSAIVVFKDQPVATYDGHLQGYEKTQPDKGKVNPNSAASKKYVGYLKAEHSDFARWLQRNIPSAKITSEYFTVLNGVAVDLHGNAIGKLAQNADVLTVEYNALYHPLMSESYKVINAGGAWTAAGGRADAGAGVKVGVIDTGIDPNHPFFDPTGFSAPAGFPKCDAVDSTPTGCKYTSAKVIVAKVFYNKAASRGYDAAPVGDHGSHVAGTIAGVTGKTAIVNGVSIDDMSGIAPGAWLGSYNVFPNDILNARSEDILDAVEAAVGDGMDVLNLSLGGAYHGNNDLLAMGLDNAVEAGVVVAVAAGNSGPGAQTVESPGRARNVITVGASTNQHFVGQPITYGSTTIGAAVGDFAPLPATQYAVVDTHSIGCTALPDLTGKLAIIDRGTCSFSVKVANAKAAGAVAAVIVNNVAGDPSAMARTAGYADDLPAVMVSKTDGTGLRAVSAATVAAGYAEFITHNADILAGFSSLGPTRVDLAVKPDLTSVGVNVLSSISCYTRPDITCGGEGSWAFYQGTSMATPHIAGSAAVLLGLHPDWTPFQVKSALVNTADLGVTDARTGTAVVGPTGQGGGREDLSSAADAATFFAPVSASFGKVSASKNVGAEYTLTLTNPTGSDQSFTISSTTFTPDSYWPVYASGTMSGPDSRLTYPPSVKVPAHGSTTVTVGIEPGLPNGTIVQGWLDFRGPGAYHVAYFAQVAP
jgi:minor extracellular serine protease Vpr